jgi:hypothetical protein
MRKALLDVRRGRVLCGSAVALVFASWALLAQSAKGADPMAATDFARGGGTTMIQGGTGPDGGFIPVVTTVAFHAEAVGGAVTGNFECLARAPRAAMGNGSAEFTTT